MAFSEDVPWREAEDTLENFIDVYIPYVTRLLKSKPNNALAIYKFSTKYFEDELKKRKLLSHETQSSKNSMKIPKLSSDKLLKNLIETSENAQNKSYLIYDNIAENFSSSLKYNNPEDIPIECDFIYDSVLELHPKKTKYFSKENMHKKSKIFSSPKEKVKQYSQELVNEQHIQALNIALKTSQWIFSDILQNIIYPELNKEKVKNILSTDTQVKTPKKSKTNTFIKNKNYELITNAFKTREAKLTEEKDIKKDLKNKKNSPTTNILFELDIGPKGHDIKKILKILTDENVACNITNEVNKQIMSDEELSLLQQLPSDFNNRSSKIKTNIIMHSYDKFQETAKKASPSIRNSTMGEILSSEVAFGIAPLSNYEENHFPTTTKRNGSLELQQNIVNHKYMFASDDMDSTRISQLRMKNDDNILRNNTIFPSKIMNHQKGISKQESFKCCNINCTKCNINKFENGCNFIFDKFLQEYIQYSKEPYSENIPKECDFIYDSILELHPKHAKGSNKRIETSNFLSTKEDVQCKNSALPEHTYLLRTDINNLHEDFTNILQDMIYQKMDMKNITGIFPIGIQHETDEKFEKANIKKFKNRNIKNFKYYSPNLKTIETFNSSERFKISPLLIKPDFKYIIDVLNLAKNMIYLIKCKLYKKLNNAKKIAAENSKTIKIIPKCLEDNSNEKKNMQQKDKKRNCNNNIGNNINFISNKHVMIENTNVYGQNFPIHSLNNIEGESVQTILRNKYSDRSTKDPNKIIKRTDTICQCFPAELNQAEQMKETILSYEESISYESPHFIRKPDVYYILNVIKLAKQIIDSMKGKLYNKIKSNKTFEAKVYSTLRIIPTSSENNVDFKRIVEERHKYTKNCKNLNELKLKTSIQQTNDKMIKTQIEMFELIKYSKLQHSNFASVNKPLNFASFLLDKCCNGYDLKIISDGLMNKDTENDITTKKTKQIKNKEQEKSNVISDLLQLPLNTQVIISTNSNSNDIFLHNDITENKSTKNNKILNMEKAIGNGSLIDQSKSTIFDKNQNIIKDLSNGSKKCTAQKNIVSSCRVIEQMKPGDDWSNVKSKWKYFFENYF